MVERNVEALRELADLFDRNPGAHRQRAWGGTKVDPDGREPAALAECGTTGCVAGWACILRHGARAFVRQPDTYRGEPQWSVRTDWPDDPEDLVDGETVWSHHQVDVEAARILGLSLVEAAVVFHESWEPARGDLAGALSDLAAGADVKSVTGWVDEDEVVEVAVECLRLSEADVDAVRQIAATFDGDER